MGRLQGRNRLVFREEGYVAADTNLERKEVIKW